MVNSQLVVEDISQISRIRYPVKLLSVEIFERIQTKSAHIEVRWSNVSSLDKASMVSVDGHLGESNPY